MAASTDHRAIGGRSRSPAIAAAAVFVAVLAGVLGAVQAMPTRYAATSVVSFVPRPESPASADTVQLVGEKYVVLAGAPATLQAAQQVAGTAVQQLGDATAVELGAGTGNVSITVTLADRDRAVAAANAVAAALVRASAGDRLVSGEQTSPAVPETVRLLPARMLLRAAGLLAAVLAAALAWTAARGRVLRRAGAPEPADMSGATLVIR
jgi:hypothetical protein